MNVPSCFASAARQGPRRYSVGNFAVGEEAAWYQTHTKTCRFEPGEAAKLPSASNLFVHAWVVRPTAKRPVGAGNMMPVLVPPPHHEKENGDEHDDRGGDRSRSLGEPHKRVA